MRVRILCQEEGIWVKARAKVRVTVRVKVRVTVGTRIRIRGETDARELQRLTQHIREFGCSWCSVHGRRAKLFGSVSPRYEYFTSNYLETFFAGEEGLGLIIQTHVGLPSTRLNHIVENLVFDSLEYAFVPLVEGDGG